MSGFVSEDSYTLLDSQVSGFLNSIMYSCWSVLKQNGRYKSDVNFATNWSAKDGRKLSSLFNFFQSNQLRQVNKETFAAIFFWEKFDMSIQK